MREHEASRLFPLLSGKELDALVADIKKNGQQEPIYTLGGKVLDGRNRLAACKRLGIKPVVEALDAGTDPYATVMSLNYHRRHLTPHQQGEAIKAYLEARGGTRNGHKGGRPGKKPTGSRSVSVSSVAKELGIPQQTASDRIKAAEDYASLPKSLKAKVDAGEVTPSIAAQAARSVEREASKEMPEEAKKVFDKAAEKRRQISALLALLSRCASGLEYHEEFFLRHRWPKADRDIVQRDLDRIRQQVNRWRSHI